MFSLLGSDIQNQKW